MVADRAERTEVGGVRPQPRAEVVIRRHALVHGGRQQRFRTPVEQAERQQGQCGERRQGYGHLGDLYETGAAQISHSCEACDEESHQYRAHHLGRLGRHADQESGGDAAGTQLDHEQGYGDAQRHHRTGDPRSRSLGTQGEQLTEGVATGRANPGGEEQEDTECEGTVDGGRDTVVAEEGDRSRQRDQDDDRDLFPRHRDTVEDGRERPADDVEAFRIVVLSGEGEDPQKAEADEDEESGDDRAPRGGADEVGRADAQEARRHHVPPTEREAAVVTGVGSHEDAARLSCHHVPPTRTTSCVSAHAMPRVRRPYTEVSPRVVEQESRTPTASGSALTVTSTRVSRGECREEAEDTRSLSGRRIAPPAPAVGGHPFRATARRSCRGDAPHAASGCRWPRRRSLPAGR